MDANRIKKRTKIICTLGPSVDDEDVLSKLIESGMDVARLNFSHGSHSEHAIRIERLKRVRDEVGYPCAIMLDTKGPEIRTGLLQDGVPIELHEGDILILSADDEPGVGGRVSQTFAELYKYVGPGTRILLDDGLIELEVESLDGADIVCRVLNEGQLGQRKSLNVPGVSVPLPSVTEKDAEDLVFGVEQGVDFVAASFVRDGDAVRKIRRILSDAGGEHIGIIAKIENADALENIEDIITAADGIMVARGDLGVEVPPYDVPHLQKRIIAACNHAHKPVITATQMLESMTVNPRPTRAEAADVANAIYDGTDCVMLSGETAVGAHPIEAVRTMVRIAETTEAHCFEDTGRGIRSASGRKSVSHAVGQAAVQTAEDVGARCIICPTMTGRTARLISSLRPPVPVFAVTPSAQGVRSMQLFWGVTPLLGDVQGNMHNVIDNAKDTVVGHGFLDAGDIAVLTCGDRFTSPIKRDSQGNPEKFAPTNVMYVIEIRDSVAKERLASAGADALMTNAFFDRERLTL